MELINNDPTPLRTRIIKTHAIAYISAYLISHPTPPFPNIGLKIHNCELIIFVVSTHSVLSC